MSKSKPTPLVAAPAPSVEGAASANALVTIDPEPEPTDTADAPEPRHPFHEVVHDTLLPRDASATKNANLLPWQCRQEVQRRKLPIARAGNHRGIATSSRVRDPLNGVRFVTPSKSSPYGLFDCRLGLTMDDLSHLLAEHGVSRLHIDNMYRPGAKLPGRRSKSQHYYGLAIDVRSFVLSDGTELSVERDWGSSVGSVACGPEAKLDEPTERSVALRNVVCAVARAGLFHHILTPSHDAAHRDHVHFDIKRDAKKTMLR